MRGEPSIDSIAALRPDLILATDELPDTAVTQMEAFAPVAFVKGNDAKDSIGTMRRNLELVAQATGKQAEASALLSAFDASLADAKTKLAANAGTELRVHRRLRRGQPGLDPPVRQGLADLRRHGAARPDERLDRTRRRRLRAG